METGVYLNLKSEEEDLPIISSTSNFKLNLTSDCNTNLKPNPTSDSHINSVFNSGSDCKTKETLKNLNDKNPKQYHQRSFKRTRYIPLHTRRKVFQRANHCCEFTGPNKERCESQYQLEIDHFVKPYSQGGDHSLDNLKLHCSQHNMYRASLLGMGVETINSHF